jgi:hypothetical protein
MFNLDYYCWITYNSICRYTRFCYVKEWTVLMFLSCYDLCLVALMFKYIHTHSEYVLHSHVLLELRLCDIIALLLVRAKYRRSLNWHTSGGWSYIAKIIRSSLFRHQTAIMSENRQSRLHKILHSLATKVPKILLQRVEIYPDLKKRMVSVPLFGHEKSFCWHLHVTGTWRWKTHANVFDISSSDGGWYEDDCLLGCCGV